MIAQKNLVTQRRVNSRSKSKGKDKDKVAKDKQTNKSNSLNKRQTKQTLKQSQAENKKKDEIPLVINSQNVVVKN